MTIWNALAAGGALFFAAQVYATARHMRTVDSWRQWHWIGIGSCLGFGLCLWGAIP